MAHIGFGTCWHSAFSNFHSLGQKLHLLYRVLSFENSHWAGLGRILACNPWLPKCTAQLPSLNLVDKLCLSNSDPDVQSVGYNSAQSPTNWESIHGKDPSILCWLSSRLSIALCDEHPKGESQESAVTQETYNHFHAICVRFGELPINTLQALRDQGFCLSKILNMRCSSLILMPEFHLCQVTSPHIQYCIILILMKPLVSGFVWLVKCPN